MKVKEEKGVEQRDLSDYVVMQPEMMLNTGGTDYGDDDSAPWDLDEYVKNLKIDVRKNDPEELEFDLINTEAPIANALRRILIAEVPTMAIEKVFMYQNTSLFQDEVFAHRLGLIPIKADPRKFEFLKKGDFVADPRHALEFVLKVRCTHIRNAPKDCCDPDVLYEHSTVYSRDLQWVPLGEQKNWFDENDRPRPVNSDILLAKLRPGQEIECRCQCVKGIGRDHAKFSPVAVASYRLLPEIIIKREEFSIGEAELLKSCFSNGVIEVCKLNNDRATVKVKNPRADMGNRNIFRYPELADAVLMTKKRRHFIFTVESTGALTSAELIVEACAVMQKKCKALLVALNRAS